MRSSTPPRPTVPPRNSSYTSLPSTLTSALSWTLSRLTAPAEPTQSSDLLVTKSPPPPPPVRRPSPFTPPPLTPLSLSGHSAATTTSSRLLTHALAEEVRALLPARLQLHDTWMLAYSLEAHGVSLATLYSKAAACGGGAHVLVVRDSLGGVFGAFVNETFKPSGGRYYGTGECFLWKAATRPERELMGEGEVLRFKAFPYSGMNDYMILCDAHFLSCGGGDDGRYGLWLDDTFEKGVSARCETFGNEPLSEDAGGKFEVMDVELWRVGS